MKASSAPPATHRLNVLLVEDSKVLAERLREALNQIDFVNLLETTDTEASAVEFLRSVAVDVIVLDLHLKQGTGFGVLRALREVDVKPQVIVLTNYDLPEYQKAACSLGATHFLDKARDYGKLSQLLRELGELKQPV